jgi:DNA (cytosine-5)-methyltransferase 1
VKSGSLFSGAGGLDLAVEEVFGARTAWHCENDPAAAEVLAARWPGVPNLGDITEVDWAGVEPIDVLCGGFPCQDISNAGRRAGLAGERSGLWAYMRDATAALTPEFVVIENVRGLVNRGGKTVVDQLMELGYSVAWALTSAAIVGACHRRIRVFIVGRRCDNPRPPIFIRGDDRGTLGGMLPTPLSGEALHGSPNQHRTRGDQMLTGVVLNEMAPPLLPTPRGRDGKGPTASRSGNNKHDLPSALLPTPAANNATSGQDYARANRPGSGGDDLVTTLVKTENAQQWGRYRRAIRLWAHMTRAAPPPTEWGPRGTPRLSAKFSEWMMGLPDGWVTDVPGVPRNEQLRMLGNGVVPQQAAAALECLLQVLAGA